MRKNTKEGFWGFLFILGCFVGTVALGSWTEQFQPGLSESLTKIVHISGQVALWAVGVAVILFIIDVTTPKRKTFVFAGKRYGRLRQWNGRVRRFLFPRGFRWFHRCRFPVVYPALAGGSKKCGRWFFRTNMGFCSKHQPIVRAGWAIYAETMRKNRQAWCATLTYAYCINWFILATDSCGTFFYIDTRKWPEWDSLPGSAKREIGATEKYMLPIAREKWASLISWQWIGYEKESEELRWIANHDSTPLAGLERLDGLNRRPS